MIFSAALCRWQLPLMAAPAWAEELKASVLAIATTVGTIATDLAALSATVAANHTVVLQRLDALDDRVGALEVRVGALEVRVGALEERVGALEERVGKLDDRVGRVESGMQALAASRSNAAARLANALKACEAPLKALPFGCDGRPWPAGIAQPATLLDLAVSGAEAKPGTSIRADWNVASSRAFLRVAVDGYDTDGTDGEGEIGLKARTARVKVIQAMGGDVAAVLATTYKFT